MALQFNPFTGTFDVTTKGDTGTVAAAGDGTATLPGIAFANDLNTGIYRPGADQLAISTNGTGRLFVDANGLVGVGSAPTTYSLEVNGGTANTVASFISTDATSRVLFKDDTGEAMVGCTGNDLTFYTSTSATERLRITSAGLVGIGTSSPGAKLTVAQAATNADTDGIRIVDSGGSPRANLYYRGSQVFEINSSSAPGGGDVETLRLSTAGNARLSITRDGKVGIGTTSPTDKLQVQGTGVVSIAIVSTDNYAQLYLGGGGTANVISSDDPLAFNVGFQERARIDSSGTFRVRGNTSNTPGTNDAVQLNGSAPANSLLLDASGRVLVGTFTSPSAGSGQYSRFVVQGFAGGNTGEGYMSLARGAAATSITTADALGVVNFTDNAGNTFGQIACLADAVAGSGDYPGRLVFSTTADGAASPTERMRIGQNGNTYINTTSDLINSDFKLQVKSSTVAALFKSEPSTASIETVLVWNNQTSGDNKFLQFNTETGPTARGSITYNRGGGVVAYNTTSDYRAKTLLGDVENPGQVIDALKVYRGVMNGATVERPMLVAHEAQEVAPYSVTGEKDAVDDDGNPIYQQMDHQVLVPLLIAEIQQLRARVAALEAS